MINDCVPYLVPLKNVQNLVFVPRGVIVDHFVTRMHNNVCPKILMRCDWTV